MHRMTHGPKFDGNAIMVVHFHDDVGVHVVWLGNFNMAQQCCDIGSDSS